MKTLKQLINPTFQRYYYFQGERVYLNSVQSKIFIAFKETTTKEEKQNLLSTLYETPIYTKSTFEKDLINDKFLIVDLDGEFQSTLVLENDFKIDLPEVEYVSAVFTVGHDPVQMAITNQLFIGIKPNHGLKDLDSMFNKYGVTTSEEFGNNIFLLTLRGNNEYDSLDVANILNESELVEYAEPSFFRSMPISAYLPNDPLYSNEWHIPKIKANEVWCWNNAGSFVSIGIMDMGINVSHPDLSANVHGTYDPTGHPLGADAHGTLCAGAALAVGNNSLGVCGVAYMAHLHQIRVGYNPTSDPTYPFFSGTDAWFVGGLNYAISNSIQILSCSFAMGSPSNTFKTRLADLATSGRGGRGAVIFASSGNDGNTLIVYPAADANVIAVGASDLTDEKASFSNYGYQLCLVAPGVNIASTNYTGTYNLGFSGTSAACPIAAGAAALMLSHNVFLTRTQVRDNLIKACDLTGTSSYLWDSLELRLKSAEMGFGRLNINNYYISQYNISGPDYFCGSQQQYTFSLLPSPFSITWSSSNPNLSVSSSGLMTNPSNVIQRTVLTATFSGGCLSPRTKNVVSGNVLEEFYCVDNQGKSIGIGNTPSKPGYLKNNSIASAEYVTLMFGFAPIFGLTTLNVPTNASIRRYGPWYQLTEDLTIQILSCPTTWAIGAPFQNMLFFQTTGDASGTCVVRFTTACGSSDVTYNIVGYN